MEILDKTGVSVLWSTIKDKFTLKSSLSKVATSGSYNDLSNKPAIPSVAGYLPLSGGTMTGGIGFAGIGDTATSGKITFNGSTDGADIYYQTTDSDQGNLVLNLRDDDNCYLRIAKNGVFKSYFTPSDGSFHGNVVGNVTGNLTGTASAVAWSNVTGKPSTFTPTSHTHSWGDVNNKPALMESNDFSSDNLEALLKKIQGLSPRMGSANILKDTRIAATWWSFLYIPHRTGVGVDNGNYGTLLLFPMAGNGSSYIIRSSSAGVVSDIRRIYTSSDKPTKSDIGLGSVDNTSDANKSVKYATTAGSANSVAWNNVSGKPTMPTNITATATTIVSISGSTIKVNASLDGYKTPGEYNIYGTSNGDYAKMYVQSGIADTFNGTRVITQTIRVTISHNTYAEVCDVTRQYKSNAWSAWTIMYLGND